MDKIEFAIVNIDGVIYPKIFECYEDAKNFINRRVEPDNWRVIRRIGFTGEWEYIDQSGLLSGLFDNNPLII